MHLLRMLILVLIGLGMGPAFADSPRAGTCMSDPSPPTKQVVLAGMPQARLYIHPKHPALCSGPDADDCKPKAYVLTGDPILVGESCGGWVYISFQGKRIQTLGWVESTLYASSLPPAPPLNAACQEAAKLFNQWINTPEPSGTIIPTARSNIQKADVLPEGTGGGAGPNVWSIEIADAHVGDKPIKTVSYGAGGTCHDNFTELWDPVFKKQIRIPTNWTSEENSSDDPGDSTGYSSEDLVQLRGKAFFMHLPRSTNYAKLWALAPDMTASAMCEVARFPGERETVTYSVDNVLCEAVAQGQVKDVGLSEIQPAEIPSATKKTLGLESFGLADNVSVVALGKADLYNTGKAESVGMLQYGRDDGAGCGHSVGYAWPELMNAQGEPLRAADRDLAFEHVGNRSRLITFRGVTYIDTRTDDSDNSTDALPMHEVWKLTSTGPTKMCRLNPVEYRAIPVPPPSPHS